MSKLQKLQKLQERLPREYGGNSFLILAGSMALTTLCLLGLLFPLSSLGALGTTIQQICLLAGVNAAVVLIGTIGVIFVGNVKRGH